MPNMGNNMSSTVGGIAGTSGLHSAATAATSAVLGLGSNGATATSNLSAPRTTPLLSSSTGTHTPQTLGMLMRDGLFSLIVELPRWYKPKYFELLLFRV